MLKRATGPIRHSNAFRAALRLWRRARVPGRSRFINVYYCCTQKTASQWLKAILRDPLFFSATGLSVEPYEKLGLKYAKLDRAFPKHTVATHLYVSYPTYANIPKPERYRTFFVMRDPRDIIVSWYYSAKYSHAPMGVIPELRRDLAGLSDTEGYKYMVDRLCEWGSFDAQRSWQEADDPAVRVFAYESLAADNREFTRDLFEYLEVDLDPDELDTLVGRNAFETRAQGRAQGQEDIHAHSRKGVAGDWQEKLTPEVLAYLEERTGDLLDVLGYS